MASDGVDEPARQDLIVRLLRACLVHGRRTVRPRARLSRGARDLLARCAALDWSRTSPAVLGALVQSLMDPRERRQIGAHYTAERDILQVLDALLLDELRAELAAAGRRREPLRALHRRLGALRILDPACGCGNFLVVACRELHALERDLLRRLGDAAPRLRLDQFHGLEIAAFPARVADVALQATARRLHPAPPGRPRIRVADALRTAWPTGCTHIVGNPPFVGHHLQTPAQRAGQAAVTGHLRGGGALDHAAAWLLKAAETIAGTPTQAAFVTTNSLAQGEQPAILWPALRRHGARLHFARTSFPWTSDARGRAHVHVVVLGLAAFDAPTRRLYDGPTPALVPSISPYLFAGDDQLLRSRPAPLCAAPPMQYGSKPSDGGHLVLTAAERDELLAAEPGAGRFLRRYLGARDVLEDGERWCLWLVDIQPRELRALPRIAARVEAVRAFRAASKAASTRAYAKYPTRFRQIAVSSSDFILVPGHTSENRRYIPFAYFTPDHIVSNACFFIPDATLYHFGVLSSIMHMAWVRQFCGRLESRFRYSKDIVYNNFPWPTPTSTQRASVEEAAGRVLAARGQFRGASLSDLYDPLTMPPVLAEAHERLDRAVDRCYRRDVFSSDRLRIEYLFATVGRLTAPRLPGRRA